MRILAMVHAWPPHHNAGAEWMAHTLMRHLARQGHQVDVLLSRPDPRIDGPYDYQGVAVHPRRDKHDPFRFIPQADVIVTHLENTERATVLAHYNDTPVVHLLHNTFEPSKRWLARGADLAVFNSRWMADDYRAWFDLQGHRFPNHVVVRPPIVTDDYRTQPGDMVTLVNLYPNKGASTFWAVAEAMPDVKFLAVTGGYGEQDIRDLPNVEVVANVPGHLMAEQVYSRTRILLMPSEYESWGRVGVEAMCSGIPVIAHPTDGLRESLDQAGTFVDRDDTDGWISAVRRLLDGRRWPAASRRARARADELDCTADLQTWTDAITCLA